MRSLVLAVVLLSGVVLLPAAPASAHSFDADLRIRFEPLPEVLDDLTIEIVTSIAPQLAIGNPTDDVVEVLDDDGVAFLRIGPDGTEANFDNRDFYFTQDPLGAIAIPARAQDSDGDPGTWGEIAVASEWAWFDHRMHPQNVVAEKVPEPTVDGVVLSTFTIPLRFRGQTVELAGSIVQVPQTGRLVAALTSVPEVDGVSVQLLEGGTAGLFLTAAADREVVVLGREGEPFLRFVDGMVEANTQSPSWYDSGRATRLADDAPPLDPSVTPDWQAVSSSPRFGWLESRSLYGRGTVDEDLNRSAVSQDLVDWEVPLLVDGERYSVTGVTRFEVFPAFADEAPTGLALWVPIGLGIAGIVVIAVVLRRRRRRVRPVTTRK